MSIVDRFDFRDTFAFTCNEQWEVKDKFMIPPTFAFGRLTRPKPDLALSFDRRAIRGEGLQRSHFPGELGHCFHPGSANHRWFPFFFIEAKRAKNSLDDASNQLFVSASQALFNIYQVILHCPKPEMERLKESFFTDIRVFTLGINIKDVVLRIHRAESSLGEGESAVDFRYDDVVEVSKYNCSQVCHIVKKVLLDYAEPVLLPILRDIHQSVGRRRAPVDRQTKRKLQDHVEDAVAERRSSSQGATQNATAVRSADGTTDSAETQRLARPDIERPKRSRTRR